MVPMSINVWNNAWIYLHFLPNNANPNKIVITPAMYKSKLVLGIRFFSVMIGMDINNPVKTLLHTVTCLNFLKFIKHNIHIKTLVNSDIPSIIYPIFVLYTNDAESPHDITIRFTKE